jgi:hypothetical protein
LINKKFNMALIGKNYLSFLLSIELMEWNMKVIILDDKRVTYGQHYTDYLCQLEYSFLMLWGEDRQIEPFQKLQHYIVKKPFSIIIGQHRVLLGNSPAQNLSELIRKFPNFFLYEELKEINLFLCDEDKQAQFNDSYYAFCSRLAENSFRFRTSQNLSLGYTLSLCPENIKFIFSVFEKAFLNQDNFKEPDDTLNIKTFLYLTRGIFHRKLSIGATEFELFHLFLSLLSPHFQLDHKALMGDLLPIFTERGGAFKKTYIKDWLFEKKRPWSLELSSYEGIIHPQKISLLGGRPESIPVKVDVKEKSFRSIDLRFALNEKADLKLGLEGQRVFYTRSQKIGGQNPFWEGRFQKNGGVLKIYNRSYKGMKIDFIKNFIIAELEKDLSIICKRPITNLLIESIHFGHDLCLEEKSFKSSGFKQDMPLLSKVEVYDCTAPGLDDLLKNVHYFGPLKRGSFGLFSTLMEIKDGPSL